VPEWPQLGAARSYIRFSQDGSVVTLTGLRGAQCAPYRQRLAERVKQSK
jgi:hypothetical protein